jgi:8-oxo-dGTP pyrophosphatase MutT (NUDIX family)
MEPPFHQLAGVLGDRSVLRVEAPGARLAAVALVLVPGADGIELLLIRRAEAVGDPWSGHMALPGGRMEEDDPDLLTTARRETLEETDVDLSGGVLLGELDDLHPTTTTLPAIVVRPFVFGLQERPAIRASHEVAYHRWAPLGQLRASQGESEVRHRGRPRRVPAFLLGEDVVWGMTHRIVEPFLRLAEGAPGSF